MHEDRGIVTSDLLRDPAFLANFIESKYALPGSLGRVQSIDKFLPT